LCVRLLLMTGSNPADRPFGVPHVNKRQAASGYFETSAFGNGRLPFPASCTIFSTRWWPPPDPRRVHATEATIGGAPEARRACAQVASPPRVTFVESCRDRDINLCLREASFLPRLKPRVWLTYTCALFRCGGSSAQRTRSTPSTPHPHPAPRAHPASLEQAGLCRHQEQTSPRPVATTQSTRQQKRAIFFRRPTGFD